MNAQVNHSDAAYKNLFGTNNVGFRLETVGLVHTKFLKTISFFFFCPTACS